MWFLLWTYVSGTAVAGTGFLPYTVCVQNGGKAILDKSVDKAGGLIQNWLQGCKFSLIESVQHIITGITVTAADADSQAFQLAGRQNC